MTPMVPFEPTASITDGMDRRAEAVRMAARVLSGSTRLSSTDPLVIDPLPEHRQVFEVLDLAYWIATGEPAPAPVLPDLDQEEGKS